MGGAIIYRVEIYISHDRNSIFQFDPGGRASVTSTIFEVNVISNNTFFPNRFDPSPKRFYHKKNTEKTKRVYVIHSTKLATYFITGRSR